MTSHFTGIDDPCDPPEAPGSRRRYAMIDTSVEAAPNPLVDLVIVNYRSYEELTRCLASLERSHAGSSGASPSSITTRISRPPPASVSRFPWVELFQRASNEGFATGVNRGVACGGGDYLSCS